MANKSKELGTRWDQVAKFLKSGSTSAVAQTELKTGDLNGLHLVVRMSQSGEEYHWPRTSTTQSRAKCKGPTTASLSVNEEDDQRGYVAMTLETFIDSSQSRSRPGYRSSSTNSTR